MCILSITFKYNLLHISQLYDKGYRIIFDSSKCKIEYITSNKVLFLGSQNNNVYTINIEYTVNERNCLASLKGDSWLWHRWLDHASMNLLSRIPIKKIVKGLPYIKF